MLVNTTNMECVGLILVCSYVLHFLFDGLLSQLISGSRGLGGNSVRARPEKVGVWFDIEATRRPHTRMSFACD